MPRYFYPLAYSISLRLLEKTICNLSVLKENMLKSCYTRYSSSRADDTRIIRLTVDQEAVLQQQFNRWPKAPHTADIVLLAAETGLSEADVEVSETIILILHNTLLYVQYCFVLGMVCYSISSVAERTRSRWKSVTSVLITAVVSSTLWRNANLQNLDVRNADFFCENKFYDYI